MLLTGALCGITAVQHGASSARGGVCAHSGQRQGALERLMLPHMVLVLKRGSYGSPAFAGCDQDGRGATQGRLSAGRVRNNSPEGMKITHAQR